MLFNLLSLLFSLNLSLPIPNLNQLQRTVSEITRFSQTHPCISQQLSLLKPRCPQITDSEKARIALTLTNCMLTQSKKSSYPCPQSQNIGDCLSIVQGDAWTSYSSFYVHVDTLCYYFSSLDWEERTTSLVDNLTRVSSLTHSTLQSHLLQTQHIINIQSDLSSKIVDSLTLQKELRESMRAHQSEIEHMTEGLQTTINHLQDNVNKHYRVITQVFSSIDQGISKISSIQTLLLGSIQEGIGSILYYMFLLLSVFTLSIVSRSIRQNFVSNIVWIMVSLGMERGIKFIGMEEMSWRVRVGILGWIVMSNVISLRRYESFEKKVMEKIDMLSGRIEDKMRSGKEKGKKDQERKEKNEREHLRQKEDGLVELRSMKKKESTNNRKTTRILKTC